MNQTTNDSNDYKVVDFHNPHDFVFTPEMGCMYDGRPIFGISGATGIAAGEKLTVPYHVGHRLAENLAKAAMIQGSNDKPQVDSLGNPMIKAIWDSAKLESMAESYVKDLYTESKPIARSETDILMEKVEELRKMVESDRKERGDVLPEPNELYTDKSEVIEELKKRGIAFDARKNKSELEKLLN